MSKQELHPRTAVLNKKQKNRSKKLRLDALTWLAAQFPAAFDNSLRIRPLKNGIMEDILQHAEKAAQDGISKSKLREAVVLFTRRVDYLACLKSRELRVDLQGHEVIEVTQEEADLAAAKIKKRIEKNARNARKLALNKPPANQIQAHTSSSNHVNQVKPWHHAAQESDDYFPTYPARHTGYNQSTPQQQAKGPSVIVKHKTTRQYDPNAVARLKEKLGLSRTLDEHKVTVE